MQQPSALFIITVLLCVGAGFYIIFNFIVARNLWIRGRVPITLSFNDDNLFEVYIAFAVLMIKSDRQNFSRKIEYLDTYFNRKFPGAVDHLNQSLGQALKDEPIKIKPAARWLNRHLHESKKVLLIYFLCDICFLDGRINRNERDILEKLCFHLQVDFKELESIIAGLESAYQRNWEKEQRNRKTRNEQKKNIYTTSKKKQMARILEVSENASFEEIKSAYRKLVKLHHPDRFQNDGVEQIELAKERFIEIQLAYEFFEDLKMR